MKKITVSLATAMLLGAALLSQVSASTIDYPEYGFSIDALDSKVGTAPSTAIMMFLPSSDGFAPNINVNIQPFPGGMKEYIALSKAQFQEMNWSIIDEKQIGETEWRVEYKGPMQGSDLHFYARAVSKDGKFYLTTATSKESQWSALGEKLRQHVESFKIK